MGSLNPQLAPSWILTHTCALPFMTAQPSTLTASPWECVLLTPFDRCQDCQSCPRNRILTQVI